MNESTALARRIALQLGDDLDRILDEQTASDIVLDTRHETGVELRQIAGLTSGAAMRLSDGSYQFGQAEAGERGLNEGTPKEVGFVLTVDGERGWLEPGAGRVTLDGAQITERTEIGDKVIEAGSARFELRVPRRPSRRRIVAADEPVETPIEVPAPGETSTRNRSTLLGAILGASSDGPDDVIRGLVEENRAQSLRRRRAAHPHPEEIMNRARNARNDAWSRNRTHPLFATVAVAYGEQAWRPQFDRPDRVSTRAAEGFHDLLVAPSVPITASLTHGPLGIIGSRPSALAVARHVVTALCTLSPPDALSLAVLADEVRAGDWAWSDRLPHNRDDDDAMPILVVDGLHHAANQDLLETIRTRGVGAILIGDDIDQLPPVCETVVLIDDVGTATVMDNRSGTTVMAATPLGLTPDLAASAVNALDGVIANAR